MPANDRFSSKQRLALRLLLEAKTLKQVSQGAGVSDKTLYRWLRQPAFRDALRRLQDEATGQVMRRLLDLASAACGTLEAVMGDDLASGSARVSAARGVLEVALRFAELSTLAERIARIEDLVGVGGEDEGGR